MDRKLKHLEFIQGVVNRLSTNSFLLKGWCVVLVSALMGFGAHNGDRAFVALAFIPTFVFWGLDAYFLALERAYRKHYDRIRKKDPDDIDFCMSIEDLITKKTNWLDAFFSKTLLPFHLALVGSIILIMLIVGGKNGT